MESSFESPECYSPEDSDKTNEHELRMIAPGGNPEIKVEDRSWRMPNELGPSAQRFQIPELQN